MTENRNFETEPHVCEAYDNSKPVDLAVERHFSVQELAALHPEMFGLALSRLLDEKTLKCLEKITIYHTESASCQRRLEPPSRSSHCSIPIMLPNFWKCIRRPCGKVHGAENRNRQFGVGSIATPAGVPSSAPQEVLL